MAVTMVFVILLILACHVVLVTMLDFSADYVGAMPEPDKSTLEAVKAAALIKGTFPSIQCHGGGDYWWDVPFRCDASRRVYAAAPYYRSLTGSIAPEIGNLTRLKYLDFSQNQLSGSIPSSIGDLTSLIELYLSYNKLSGIIPSSIGNLTSLTELSLSRNQLSESIPSSIGDLTSLISLSLSYNQLSGSIPSSIGDLTSLTKLHLHRNQLSGSIPSSIGNLENLGFLLLGRNQLSGSIPSSIGNLTSLLNIGLFSNQLSGGIPSSISNLDRIERFFVANNYFTGPIVRVNKRPTCVSLSTNCLINTTLPVKCATSKQRSISDCKAFCDATQPGGPCGGGGICSIGTNGPSCACNGGLSNQASKFICK